MAFAAATQRVPGCQLRNLMQFVDGVRPQVAIRHLQSGEDALPGLESAVAGGASERGALAVAMRADAGAELALGA